MPYPAGVTHLNVAAALRSTRSLYPNPTAVAYFRPNSLTLHFEQFNREEYAAIAGGDGASANRGTLETVAHELTHWSDQVSSVWGQEYLVRLFDAHAAASSNREEGLYRLCRTLRRRASHTPAALLSRDCAEPTPSRCTNSLANRVQRWTRIYLDGRVDETRPIYFVVFKDHEFGARVARQPITIGALLETTATWSELRVGLGIISSLSGDQRTVEVELWQRERLQPLYEPGLTLYTAPAHMLARFTGKQ